MPTLWIKNARVIDPASKRDAVGDLFVKNGKIVDSLSATDRKRAKLIDATGLVACPGLVDVHVHFREPGQTQAADSRFGTTGNHDVSILELDQTRCITDGMRAGRTGRDHGMIGT